MGFDIETIFDLGKEENEIVNERKMEVHKQDMKFNNEVEIIWREMNKNWNMERLFLNYIEVNEFKLCIENGLNKIK